YSMVAGFRPFQGRGNSTIAHKVRHGEPLPVSTLDVKLPPEVDALIARAMAKNPSDRFQNGMEMASAVRRLRGVETSITSTDAKSVIQETRAHVACMDPAKRGEARGDTTKATTQKAAAKSSAKALD